MILEPIATLLAVCRMSPSSPIPDWATRGIFFSVSRTPDELSIVCDQSDAPDDVRSERNWRCLKVVGPLDFTLTGILASLATPLAQASISIFAISTFDTDYLLVQADVFERAVEILIQAGHEVQRG
jgi:hypothetical protein